ncbi:hypothetical protein [Brevibacillus sp. MER 51]|uniref:hypothetical protein n=1 Tax=Brevibacillus sp. MER 51 TaxID=2939560 RepID=UPI00203D0A94|nr:hypothetical protein [Brevibacillus sp. MER 51]MCM3144384.1 hypothetical protein [Brevibacillus sp. MER 51]
MGTNLLTPDQSSGATGKTGMYVLDSYVSLQRIENGGLNGGPCLYAKRGTTGTNFAIELRTEAIPVTPGKEYEFIVWLKQSNFKQGLKARIEWHSSSSTGAGTLKGQAVAVRENPDNSEATYDRYYAKGVVPPAGAYFAEVVAEYYTGSSSDPKELYWSDAYFGAANIKPTVLLTTENNLVLTEGNAFSVQGSATDVDNGNVVTVKYQINSGTPRAAHSGVSNGSTPISFAKLLTYRGGRLYDGAVDVSGSLAEGTTHTLTVWAEDDQGGKSDIVTRSITVKHNKAPVLTVNAFTPVHSGLIPPDTLTLSGTVSEPDGNTVTVKGKLNSGSEKTLLSGVSTGNWSFPFKVSELQAGANTLTITASDQFGSSSVKSFSINNSVVQTPLKKAVARYKIIPPRGTAKEILAWLKREKGDLVVDGEASFVDAGQPEQYVSMSKNSIDLTSSISEDELLSTVATAKSNLTFKLTFSRSTANSVEAATMMVGVIE